MRQGFHVPLLLWAGLLLGAHGQAKPTPPPMIRSAEEARQVRAACAASTGLPPLFTNSVGMSMVLIPAAEFTMGRDREVIAPSHRVRISRPFYVARTETTEAQYAAIAGASPADDSGERAAQHPVGQITFFEAKHFCARLSKQEGTVYRLPTEAEWELAAGAGTLDDGQAQAYAWHLGNSDHRVQPVAQRKPGPFGLFDATGNVWEWTLDVVGAYPTNALTVDPLNTQWEWKPHRKSRIIRGGCYSVPAEMCVAWRRVYVFEQFTAAPFIGFRVVMEVSDDSPPR